MSRKDGSQVFREMRQKTKDIKVILISGDNEQDATQEIIGRLWPVLSQNHILSPSYDNA